jgi:hypothetical protein
MVKRFFFTIISVTGLLISACKVQTGPATSTPGLPVDMPEPSFTPTVSPSTISGEFVLTNTSAPGMDVGIETMAIILEYRLSTADPWKKVEVDCSFDPPAPLVLKKELIVQYECRYEKQLPLNMEVHTTAEVKIYGSEEVFNLEVNSP